MQNNALDEIQRKYAGCNLLMPVSSEVQMNPFYKITVMEVTMDTSEKSGDIFKVGTVKVGKNYIDTFSLAKPALMKLAAAAGIQFDPEHTYGTRVDKNTYKAKAYGAMRMPDGTGKTHADEKVICLDDEEASYRIEFMDKSIKGITDKKAADAAADMFKGKWIDSMNKWNEPCRAYVIDDVDREKYIERSVLVNMTLLRKTVAEKAMTGAINRVIRALIGLKGQYIQEELNKPFAIARATFSPDYNDPEVKRALLSQGMNSIGSLFGTPSIPTASPAVLPEEKTLFDPEEYANNPAFASDNEPSIDEPPIQSGGEDKIFNQESEPPQNNQQEQDGYVCDSCGTPISEKVYGYSVEKFDRPLCVKCQRGGGR